MIWVNTWWGMRLWTKIWWESGSSLFKRVKEKWHKIQYKVKQSRKNKKQNSNDNKLAYMDDIKNAKNVKI